MMELGEAFLRRTSSNFLLSAVHPRHGLVWSDGTNVFLTAITRHEERLLRNKHFKLGEFEGITSLSWSCDFPGGWCYLCLVQAQKLSIWRVEGDAPQLKLKLVRKISKTPLPQGCLWNPVRDVLAIATAEQCSLYFRHTDKKNSLPLPLPPGVTLRCACWSESGDRLYVASSSTLWVYTWPQIDVKIKEFSTHDFILDSDCGNVRCVASVGRDDLLLTTEMPLEKLCKQERLSENLDMNKAIQSPTSTLFNLTTNRSSSVQSSAQLVLASISGNSIRVVKKADLSGILSPDLLAYVFDGNAHSVVVGSNAQSSLKYYSLNGLGNLIHQHDIMLPDDERPKGLCPAPSIQPSPDSAMSWIYLLVGKVKPQDSAFLSASPDMSYSLKLSLAGLYLSEVKSEPLGNSNNTNNFGIMESSPLNQLSEFTAPFSAPVSTLRLEALQVTLPKITNSESTTKPTLPVGTSAAAQGSENGSSVTPVSPPISSKHSSSSIGGSQVELNVINNADIWMRNISQSETSLIHPSVSPKPNNLPAISASLDEAEVIRSLESDIRRHDELLKGLAERVANLTQSLEEISMISVCHYQSVSAPEFCTIECSIRDQSVMKQAFLLDRGRLKLDILLATFNTNHLMLHIVPGCPPIVLTSNIDGYIPMKFEPGHCYHVQSNSPPNSRPSQPSITQTPNHTESRSTKTTVDMVNGGEINGMHRHSTSGQDDAKMDQLKKFIQKDASGESLHRLQTLAAERRLSNQKEPIKPSRRSNKQSSSSSQDESSPRERSRVDVTIAL